MNEPSNGDYYEAIFATVSDEDIFAAFVEVDQVLQTASHTTVELETTVTTQSVDKGGENG